MIEIPAIYYNGISSARYPVTLRVDSDDRIAIAGMGRTRSFSLSEVVISSRLGNTPRSIAFPDGSKCEVADNDRIDGILSRAGQHRWHQWIHLLESHKYWIAMIILSCIASAWTLIEFGIPALSARVANAIPISTEEALAEGGLQALEQLKLFSSTELDADTLSRLDTLFSAVTESSPGGYRYRLLVRKSERLGANAFALPSGIIILTDGLVNLAENDIELTAILAHEIGHVVNRHSLRALLQNSAVGLLIASVTGDIVSITSLSASLPTLLAQMRYSRGFEAEADRYALSFLKQRDIPIRHFADFLTRLEQSHSKSPKMPAYLNTHPDTIKRIRLLEKEYRNGR